MNVAIITGASRGIGRAIALTLAENNTYIAICGRHSDTLLSVTEEVRTKGSICHAFTGDVSDYSFAKSMVDTVLAEAGHIDFLINNAAVSKIGLFTDLTPDDWSELINTNLTSIYNTCHCAVPSMVSKKSGRILNISSVWGLVGASCEVAYSASKGAVCSFTKALAKELAPSNISVNAIACGAVDTERNAKLTSEEKDALCEEIPYGKMATPEEAATCVSKILSMPSYLTGEVIKFDGGWI